MRANPKIVLASQSPRRKELLSSLGLSFEIMPSNVEEIVNPDLAPDEVVADLAFQKAQDVRERLSSQGENALIIGADTIVVLDGEVIGKPESKDNAHKMLSKLSQRRHIVYTGVRILGSADQIDLSATETSYVHFRKLEAKEITAYIETGEPMDKAGAYALQGTGSAFVEKIEGCFTNIIGLPIPKTVALLRQAGVTILGMPQ